MDIELLSKMIAQLLPEHHEVGLPGLGTFVSEFVPASFSDRGYTINPPYRRITFVPGSVQDESLVELYAASNDIDADQARSILRHTLEQTRKELIERKVVVFPGLGRLRATRENNLFFICEQNLDIWPGGFALPSVSLRNHEESPGEIRHVVSELAGIVEQPVELIEAAEPQQQPEPVPQSEPEPQQPEPEPEPQPKPEPEQTPKPEYIAPQFTAKTVYETPQFTAKTVYEQPEVSLRKPEYSAPEIKVKKPAYSSPAMKVRKRISKWVWLAPLITLLVAGALLGAFLVLAQVAPDFIDSLLYTPEELRILNY